MPFFPNTCIADYVSAVKLGREDLALERGPIIANSVLEAAIREADYEVAAVMLEYKGVRPRRIEMPFVLRELPEKDPKSGEEKIVEKCLDDPGIVKRRFRVLKLLHVNGLVSEEELQRLLPQCLKKEYANTLPFLEVVTIDEHKKKTYVPSYARRELRWFERKETQRLVAMLLGAFASGALLF